MNQEREEMILSNLGLVHMVSNRFSRICGVRMLDPEDLISEGTIGLIKACDIFDPSRNLAFSTIAVPYIRGYIQLYLRDRADIIRTPRSKQKPIVLRLERTVDNDNEVELKDLLISEDDFSNPLVEEFLRSLSIRDKEVVLFLVNGYTQAEISRHYGVTRPAIGAVVRRVRARYTSDFRRA